MNEKNLRQVEQGSICETTESKHIITTSLIAQIDLFCHVVSEVLERLTQTGGNALQETKDGKPSDNT